MNIVATNQSKNLLSPFLVKGFKLKSMLFFTILTLSFSSFTSNALGQCSNVTNPGSIGGEQLSCGAFDPSPILSIANPSGGSGAVEYVWLQSNTLVANTPGNPHWTLISGATGSTYDPGLISQTTYFLRCSRNSGCTNFIGESNVLKMTVNPTFTTSSTASATSCTPDSMKVCNLSDYNGSRTIDLPNFGGSSSLAKFSLINNSGKLYQFSDGTAHLVAKAQKTNDPNKQWAVSLWFKDKKDWTAWSAGGKSYKNGGGLTNAHLNWDYYVMDNAKQNTLTGLLDLSGVELDLALNGNTYGFQIGNGANDKDADFGISFWFTYTSSTPNYNGHGDFNIDASCGNAINGGATASVSVTGNSAPYVYSWSNGLYGNEAKGLAAGSYDVNITDVNGCSVIENIVVNGPPCCNVTNPGLIANDQTGCAPFNPNLLTSLIPASGGSNTPEYVWITNTVLEPVAFASGWITIPGANGSTYDPGPLAQTTYFIRCARNVGCTNYIAESNIITITVFSKPTSITSSTDILCNGGNDGTAIVSVTGGTAPYAYSWNNGATTATISSLTTGNYYAIITDANGCAANSDTTTVNEPTQLVVSTSATNSVCNGSNNGTATVSVTGGTAPYSYLWNNGATTATISSLIAGNYYAVITDANGCSVNSDTTTVNEPTQLVVSTSATNSVCNGSNNGTATVSVTGGTAPYSYLWNNGVTTATISSLIAGNYYAMITDANGCAVYSDTTTVNEPTQLVVSTSATDVVCNGSNNGTATVSVTGGTAPYSYLWNNGVTTATISSLTAGNYYAIITDVNGCTANSDTTTVNEPTQLAASTSATDVVCNGDNNGTATVSVIGGTAPYSYLWSNGATTATTSSLIAGNYYAIITDANGCSVNSDTTAVNEPTQLVVSTSATNVICNGSNNGTATVSVTGGAAPYSYLWNNGATTATISSLTAGNYYAIITDANGCSVNSDTTNVNEPTQLTASAYSGNILCTGGSGKAIVIVTGGTAPYTYLWNHGATTATVFGLTAGNYYAVITDANGCTINSDTTTVNNPIPLIASTSTTNVACNGGNNGTATVSVTGGAAPYTYLWNNGANTATISGLTAGNYYAVVTDANLCSVNSATTINEPIHLTASASTTNIACNGGNNGTATVSVTGGTAPYSYLWNNGATTATISSLTAGSYHTLVTDANGCTASAITNVEEPTTLATTVSSNYSCLMGTATINASGGTSPYTYLWSNGDSTTTIIGLNAGIYSVTVTDANGCSRNDSVEVVQSPNLSVYANTNQTACSNTSTAFVSGGTPGYSYNWTQGGNIVSSSNPAIDLPPGLTNLTVTDANGCTAIAQSIFINNPIPMTVSVSLSRNLDALATPQNGAAPYTFLWDDPNGTTSDILLGSGAQGNFTVTVTDSNGCVAIGSITLQQANSVVLNAFPNPFAEKITLSLKSNYDTKAEVSLYNLNGTKVEDVYSGEIIKDRTYEFKANQEGKLKSNVYIYKIVTPEGVQHHRIIAK